MEIVGGAINKNEQAEPALEDTFVLTVHMLFNVRKLITDRALPT